MEDSDAEGNYGAEVNIDPQLVTKISQKDCQSCVNKETNHEFGDNELPFGLGPKAPEDRVQGG